MRIIQPKKKPKGKDLTFEEQEKNRLISSIRVRVEHVMSGKDTASSKINCGTGKKGLVI
ncbi:transposase family protein [Candidatus Poribacteria bacterium]|nr:transposase family protein [Candidatus Poribacteria bacterium]